MISASRVSSARRLVAGSPQKGGLPSSARAGRPASSPRAGARAAAAAMAVVRFFIAAALRPADGMQKSIGITMRNRTCSRIIHISVQKRERP